MFETNTIGVENEAINVDDVTETAKHFRCIDMVIDLAKADLTERFIPEEVADKMKALLRSYNAKEEKLLEDIPDFHVKFEQIHPFYY